MTEKTVHRNLDTSFVNLSALVKFLRRRQFLGTIKIRLNGYDAEIALREKNRLGVKEHDHISGRVSEGEEAFQRVLIRAREGGGTIDVFQNINGSEITKSESAKQRTAPVPSKPVAQKPQKTVPSRAAAVAVAGGAQAGFTTAQVLNGSVVEVSIVEDPFGTDAPIPKPNGRMEAPATNSERPIATTQAVTTPKPNLPDFPFLLSNRVEEKAKRRKLETKDWQILLKLTVELLGVVDRSLALRGLDFAAAFKKVRGEIAGDYPFLSPSENIFDYSKGRISMTEQVAERIFVGSIAEALSKILDRLASKTEFEDLSRDTSRLISSLISKRQQHYDRFGMTQPLRKILR
ncbi:MAG: hypothetical protein R2684_13965 [Pyrinomonadaceae bacterium]